MNDLISRQAAVNALQDMLDTNYGIEVYYDSTLNKWRARHKH